MWATTRPRKPGYNFSAGEHHRLYEVQVGNDTILVRHLGAGYGGEGDEVLDQLYSLTDDLVRSITSSLPN